MRILVRQWDTPSGPEFFSGTRFYKITVGIDFRVTYVNGVVTRPFGNFTVGDRLRLTDPLGLTLDGTTRVGWGFRQSLLVLY